MNVWPQNRGNVGNASEPSTPDDREIARPAPSARSTRAASRRTSSRRCTSCCDRSGARRRRASRRAGSRRAACARRSCGPRRPSSRPSWPSSVISWLYEAPVASEKSPHRARSTRGPRSRIEAGRRSCHKCGGSTTWSSTLMIFGSSVMLRPSVRSSSGSCCRPESKPPCLRMNVVARLANPPAVGGAEVLVVVPTQAHRVRLLVDEDEVLHAGGPIAVELDDRHVADELATLARLRATPESDRACTACRTRCTRRRA